MCETTEVSLVSETSPEAVSTLTTRNSSSEEPVSTDAQSAEKTAVLRGTWHLASAWVALDGCPGVFGPNPSAGLDECSVPRFPAGTRTAAEFSAECVQRNPQSKSFRSKPSH